MKATCDWCGEGDKDRTDKQPREIVMRFGDGFFHAECWAERKQQEEA